MAKIDRLRVHEKCNGHCSYCGKEITVKEMQVDHVVPQWKQKDPRYYKVDIDINSFENLMPACRRCNHYKRGDGLESFRESMKTLHKRISDNYINKVGLDFGIMTLTPFSGTFYFEALKPTKDE